MPIDLCRCGIADTFVENLHSYYWVDKQQGDTYTDMGRWIPIDLAGSCSIFPNSAPASVQIEMTSLKYDNSPNCGSIIKINRLL